MPGQGAELKCYYTGGCIHVSTQAAEGGGARHTYTLSLECSCSRMIILGFPGGPVVKAMPASAAGLALTPDPGRSRAAEQLSLRVPIREAQALGSR